MHILTLDPRANPAITLYETWKNALENTYGPLTIGQTKSMYYGRTPNYGIGQFFIPDPRPGAKATIAQAGIAFGYVSGKTAAYFNPSFVLTPEGEFRFPFAPTGGWEQRDRVALNTFLSWRRFANQNSWHVSLTENYGQYGRYDWRDPLHYVNDKTLGLGNAYGNYGGSAWLRLEEVDSKWTIQFSRNSTGQGHATDEAAFLKMGVLRERRYRSWERQYRIDVGEINPAAPRSRLTPEQHQERFDKATKTLSGLLVVTRRPTSLMKKETA